MFNEAAMQLSTEDPLKKAILHYRPRHTVPIMGQLN